MKNKHYRTQSLPESVYTHQMLHLTQQPDYHHGHGHGYPQLSSHHHPASHLKKRTGAALRRSQTSVCDLLQGGLQGGLSHHRAPLTAGLYEQFLPPPNFNAIGLPVNNRVGRTRPQSFYYRSSVSSVSPYSYPVCDQSPAWYHRSVPNIASSYPSLASSTNPGKSVTSPLFVDCSVEYDLGEQPVIPADSEPLLSIHPDYVAKCRSVPASPYERLVLGTNNNNNNNKMKQCDSHSQYKSLPALQQLQQESSLPRRTGIGRSNRSSPRARCNLNSKLEATRKLSVESRDSGIGMMSSGWNMFNAGCDNSNFSSYPPHPPPHHPSHLPHLSDQQTEYTGKVLPSNNKRFALTDLMSGLLCCSVPPYHHQADQGPGLTSHQAETNRTMEWVVASQKMVASQARCKMGQCNQDCGDGFCYNVWNNMNSLVHV